MVNGAIASLGFAMVHKSNQLVLDLFERGPELEDASSQYQQICYSYGELVDLMQYRICYRANEELM